MKLPIILMDVSDNDSDAAEVDYVSFVDRPAIKENWNAFNDKPFFFADQKRQIVTGAIMIADMPIYRKDNDFGEYYSMFKKEAIEKIVMKFFRKGYQSNVNLMHEKELICEGITMFESWIVDRSRGVMPLKGYEDISDGSWFGSFKVDNPAVWQLVEDGKLQGFSIEGLFKYKPLKQALSDEDKVMKIKHLLNFLQ